MGGIGIIILVTYLVIAVLIFLVANFIDGRKLGKGEITRQKAESDKEDNAVVAIAWPILAACLLALAPFIIVSYIGNGARKFGEFTTTSQHISDCDDLSGRGSHG
jgi:formate hydrogenlyase subunit 3/multisubunit Na+/H+ antiporter MnhD subunit